MIRPTTKLVHEGQPGRQAHLVSPTLPSDPDVAELYTAQLWEVSRSIYHGGDAKRDRAIENSRRHLRR